MAKQDVKLFIKQHEAIHEVYRHAHNKRMNMKLFMLRDKQSGNAVRDEGGKIIHYPNKQSAKNARVGTQVVSLGVDHRKYIYKKGDI